MRWARVTWRNIRKPCVVLWVVGTFKVEIPKPIRTKCRPDKHLPLPGEGPCQCQCAVDSIHLQVYAVCEKSEVNGQTWQRSNSWLSGRLFQKAAVICFCLWLGDLNHSWQITCCESLEHVGTCWNAILVHIRTISQSVREMLSGETVLHFRARGFPYEIDLKVHMQVSN